MDLDVNHDIEGAGRDAGLAGDESVDEGREEGAETTGTQSRSSLRSARLIAWVRWAGLDFWFPCVAVVGVLILTMLAISGSSLAMWSTDGQPDSSALVAGSPRPIRSDEWLAISPIKTGRVQADFPATQTFGMGEVETGASWRQQVVQRSLPAALYAPFNIPLAWLPLEQGFALYWWLPFLACLLGVYAWLRVLGSARGVAAAAAILVTSAPALVWWSGWMGQNIAFSVIPCALIVGATRVLPRRRALGIGLAVLGGFAAAGLPWFYQPWGIPAALFVGGVTACWGLGDATHRRRFLVAIAIAGSIFAVESLVYLAHERAYYEALANTAYPGDRREVGGGLPLGRLFSSMFPVAIARDPGGVIGDNVSEISMGWTIAFPVALAVLALGRRTVRRDPDRILLFGSTIIGLALTSWCLIRWPRSLGLVTGITFSPAQRVAPFVGFFGVICLALLLGNESRRAAIRRELGKSGVVAIGLGTAAVAAWGASDFHILYFPGVSTIRVLLSAAVAATIVTLAFTRWARWAVLAAIIGAAGSAAIVNPLMHGLGALDHSSAAATVRAVDRGVVRPAHGNWAGDSLMVNGLINGQGANSLSSFNDPVSTRGWRILDPRGRYEYDWNRFAYITFDWSPGRSSPRIEAPVADQVHVAIDPCDPRLDRLHLTAVVSSQVLVGLCLTQLRTIEWMGGTYGIYRRDGTVAATAPSSP